MTMHRRLIHTLVVVLMLLGLGATGIRPAAAQDAADSYVDPTYDWEVSWDDDVWTVVENAAYDLVLWNEGDSYVFFQNRDEWGDAGECLDGRVDEVAAEDGVDDLEPLEDEDGDPIGSRSNARASATYSLTYTDPNAADARATERVNGFDCRVLVPGEAVLAITYVTSAAAYEEDVDAVDDLLADLDIPETTGRDDEPTTTPDDEATDTPEDEPTATPEDDQPTGTPADEIADEAPDPTAGIDGNTYVSPTYGYTLEWDEDVWTPDFELQREADRDVLVLARVGTGDYVYFEAYDAYDGDPETCLEGSVDEAFSDAEADESIEDIEPYEDANGDVVAGETDGVAFAAYTLTLVLDEDSGVDLAAYFECRTLVEDEAVLAVSMVTDPATYEDARDDLDDLLSTLDLSDVQGGTASPDGTATSEPDDEETATPDADDQAGVNDNTYTSPTYGYTVEWDEDVWEVDEAFTGSGDRDTLALNFGSSGYVLFEAYDAYDGDPEECLDGSSSETLDDRDVDDVEPYEDQNGVEVAGEIDGRVFAAYTFDFDGTPAAGLFECRTLVEDEAVLAMSLIAEENEFEDALDALAEVVDTIELQGDAGAAAGDDGTATPEDDETPTPDGDDSDAGVNGDSYTSPTYGYTLEWDEDLWEADAERTDTDDRDVLVLDYTDRGTLYVEGYDAYDGDPEECLAGSADEILEAGTVDNVEPLEDEDGNVIEGDEDGVAFAAYAFEFDGVPAVGYFTCQTLVEDEAVLAFSLLAAEDEADEAVEAFMDVQGSLELPDSADQDDTRTPPDDETPIVDTTDTAGVNGNAYQSPTYGFTLEWDEDVWEVDEASSEDDVDRLVLTAEASTVTVEAMEAFDGDAEACVAAAEDEIADRPGVDDVEVLEDEQGPIAVGDEEYAYAYYGYSEEQRDGETQDLFEYVECSVLDDGASVIRISQVAPISEAEAETDALFDLLDGLELATTTPPVVRTSMGIAA